MKARLAELVRIPSVSDEAFPAGEVRRSAEATANLVSPIIINPRTQLGKQVVLENNNYSLRQRILQE